MVIDEDADIDESCDGADEECPAVQQVSGASRDMSWLDVAAVI